MTKQFSIVIPAKNEASNLEKLLPSLTEAYPDAELIVVNDGSNDHTQTICTTHDVICITHPYSQGNGAAIKTGARKASCNSILFMDADGQHQTKDIASLLDKFNSGYDMVVGARSHKGQASLFRLVANKFYNKLASFMTGHKIDDLTSGFRIVDRKKFLRFLYLLPNGFSYPTTSTMAFFRSGYSVGYHPIDTQKREGTSHIKLAKDGIRFFTIILKIGALFSPMRLFLPISFFLFIIGLSYYFYTFFSYNRFTNMSALLFISSLIIFMLGILSEQISSLHYRHMDDTTEN